MSGQDIIIKQLRAEVERLRERAEKAERFIATADSEWKVRAEKAEREIERLRSDAKTLASEHFAADYRAAIARADKAEDERDEARAELDAYKRAKAENDDRFMRERDEARAERDALHVALELAEVEVALDRSWCRICRTECRGAHRGRREHMHATECVLDIRAHAAKAVKP